MALQRAKDVAEMPDILSRHMESVPDDPIVASRRLKLSDIMREKDYWRIYIDRYHHGPALSGFKNFNEDPESFYDNDQSRGFKQSMLEAYAQVLDGDLYEEQFKTDLLTFDQGFI